MPALFAIQWSYCLDFLYHLMQRLHKFPGFTCRYPLQPQSLLPDAELTEHAPQEGEPSERIVITLFIVAVTGMASEYHNAVCAGSKSLDHELGVYPAGAHEPDKPHICGLSLLYTAYSVCRCIRAPIAQEPEDFRLKVFYRSTS